MQFIIFLYGGDSMIYIFDFYEIGEVENRGIVYNVSFERITSEGYKDYKVEMLVETDKTVWCKTYITEWDRETEEETEHRIDGIFELKTIEILQDEFLSELNKLSKFEKEGLK